MNSMTGFGRAILQKNEREYVVEIKSVNHKYSDITVKGPRSLLYLEDKIRKCVISKVSRGKIDVYITYKNYGIEGRKILLNEKLAKAYIEALQNLAKETGIQDEIKVTEISKFPDVLDLEDDEGMEEISQEVLECVNMALDDFTVMRAKEANKIREDLENRIQIIEETTNKISEISSGLVEEYIVKLEKRIQEILKTDVVDKNRLAQEIVIYADKCSIEEELTRLKSHITQFKDLIYQDGSVGKRIDFLLQEMNREVNTMGSKSGSLEITNKVVDLKTILEDIREQIQNIE